MRAGLAVMGLALAIMACGTGGDGTPAVTPTTTGGGTGADVDAGGTAGADTAVEDATGGGSTGATAGDAASGDTGGDGAGADANGDTAAQDPCPGGCDDGKACTKDKCGPGGICEHTWLKSQDCLPTLAVTAPERAAMLDQAAEVTVAGTFSSPTDTIESFGFNGQDMAAPKSPFALPMAAHHGINIVSVGIKDAVSRARAVQSFMMAESYYPTTDGLTAAAEVKDGLSVFIGAEFFDDDDTSDLDDLASFVWLILDSMNIAALIPDPLTAEGQEPGFGWCKWTVSVQDVQYSVYDLDLKPAPGGIVLSATLSDVAITFSAIAPGFGCPDVGGTATASTAGISAFVTVALDADGVLDVGVAPGDVDVVLGELSFDLTQGVGSYFDFLFNWFSGTIAGWIESSVEGALVEKLVPLLSNMLSGVSDWAKTFEIPPFLGGTEPISATVRVTPSTLSIDKKGARLGLGITTVIPKGVDSLVAKGSIARAGCFDGEAKPMTLPSSSPIAMALHDDLINEGLFAAWWGGVMHQTIDQQLLSGLLPDLPVENLTVTIDPRLPPVLTDCTDDGKAQLQIGDLRMVASFDFDGKPAEVEAWASAMVGVELDVSAAPGATVAIGFGVTELKGLEFQIVGASGAIEGAENFLDLLVSKVVKDVVLEFVGDGVFGSFPVPQFDLGLFVPGLPEGTVLSFLPEGLVRDSGYTVLSGKVTN